jgi:hypothetical protein
VVDVLGAKEKQVGKFGIKRKDEGHGILYYCVMPTVLQIKGYKFKFYSNESDEPAHVHVTKGNGNAKIWLRPDIAEEYSYNFTVRERRDIRKLVEKNYETLIKEWDEYFA